MFLLVSAGLHLWGLKREVAAIEVRREEIASSVARAREMRENVDGVRVRLQSIAALEAEGAGWTERDRRPRPPRCRTPPICGRSRSIPPGCGWRASARSASAVVPALEAHPAFSRVSLAAPVRFEQGDAGERFDVVAQLVGPAGGGQE